MFLSRSQNEKPTCNDFHFTNNVIKQLKTTANSVQRQLQQNDNRNYSPLLPAKKNNAIPILYKPPLIRIISSLSFYNKGLNQLEATSRNSLSSTERDIYEKAILDTKAAYGKNQNAMQTVADISHKACTDAAQIRNIYAIASGRTGGGGTSSGGGRRFNYVVDNSVEVKCNGENTPVFREGSDFTITLNEIKIDLNTGLVQNTHGVSLDVVPSNVSKFGEAYRIDSFLDGLAIIQRGIRLEHFEIIPSKPMPLNEFLNLLNQIKTTLID